MTYLGVSCWIGERNREIKRQREREIDRDRERQRERERYRERYRQTGIEINTLCKDERLILTYPAG